jgi:hypothetical protein
MVNYDGFFVINLSESESESESEFDRRTDLQHEYLEYVLDVGVANNGI